MKRPTPAQARTARIGSGLVLFAYVVSHLTNHMAGLWSLEAMEAGGRIFRAVWRSPPGTVLLYGALLVHVIFVLWALIARRSLKMPLREAFQVILGLAIPVILAKHAVGTRGLHEIFGVNDGYTYVLMSTWAQGWWPSIQLLAGLVAAWVHGCLGLYAWLRLKPWFASAAPWLLALALLVPVLAINGFAAGGRAAVLAMGDPVFSGAFRESINWPGSIAAETADAFALRIRIAAICVIALLFIGRLVRGVMDQRRGLVVLTYPGIGVVRAPKGSSVLEASRLGDIPHASVCGGRGRCSTCRVRVVQTAEPLPEPLDSERRVLVRVAAAPDVRLACQLRPVHDISVLPLLPPDVDVREAFGNRREASGVEQSICVMFSDIRGFTQLAESKLPYDVVFLINQFAMTMGGEVVRAGGHVDKFLGDGVMALFGIGADPGTASRNALAAAKAMSAALEVLNERLAHDLKSPLRIGIGLHTGPAVVGEMGWGTARGLTAVGDTVNTASRLETETKAYAAELVISEAVAEAAGFDVSDLESETISIRGREGRMRIYVVPKANAMVLPEG